MPQNGRLQGALGSPQHWMVGHKEGGLKMTSEGQDKRCFV